MIGNSPAKVTIPKSPSMEPYIGMTARLVIGGEKQRFAAIVTHVWDSDMVSLHVFDDPDHRLYLAAGEQPRQIPRLPKDGQIKPGMVAWEEATP